MIHILPSSTTIGKEMLSFNELGRYGRLGNQMFQIASTIGIAKKFGYDYAFPEWINWDAKDRFGSDEDIYISKYLQYDLPRTDQQLPIYFMHWGYHDVNVPDNVSLSGHMQSERYFEHCADEIRKVFTFKDEFDKNDYTALHIRMGDYGSDYHPICSKEYYERAINIAGGKILLFSDDKEAAVRHLQPFYGDIFIGTTIDSLKMMKACKRHIIANSTFSWWGAWLANSELTIAPKQWFGPAASHLETRDIYSRDTIII
jgi:hypothetical protein